MTVPEGFAAGAADLDQHRPFAVCAVLAVGRAESVCIGALRRAASLGLQLRPKQVRGGTRSQRPAGGGQCFFRSGVRAIQSVVRTQRGQLPSGSAQLNVAGWMALRETLQMMLLDGAKYGATVADSDIVLRSLRGGRWPPQHLGYLVFAAMADLIGEDVFLVLDKGVRKYSPWGRKDWVDALPACAVVFVGYAAFADTSAGNGAACHLPPASIGGYEDVDSGFVDKNYCIRTHGDEAGARGLVVPETAPSRRFRPLEPPAEYQEETSRPEQVQVASRMEQDLASRKERKLRKAGTFHFEWARTPGSPTVDQMGRFSAAAARINTKQSGVRNGNGAKGPVPLELSQLSCCARVVHA